MKIITLQEKLKEGLSIIERVTTKSLTFPILNNGLIKTEKNFLSLSATDLEIGVTWWILSKNEKEGEAVIPVRLLSSVVNLLPNKQITLEKTDNFLEVKCDDSKTRIKSFSAEDFPIIPQLSSEESIDLDAALFCRGLAQVIDIAMLSQARPEISGIYFSFQKELLKIAATDSFRLGEKSFYFEKTPALLETVDKGISFILPQKTAREIINIFSERQGKLKIYFSPNQVLFEGTMKETSHPQVQLISRLIEGEYPAYQEIIPKKHETQVVVNRSGFLNQLKIASLFGGKINEIKFKISPSKGEMEIFSQSPDTGEHNSSLKGKIQGTPLEASFNHRFLLDGLLTIKSAEIIFELNGEEGPAVLKPVGDQSYIYVVMPIRAS